MVRFRARAGEDYLVRVSGWSSDAVGSGNLTFSVTPDCSADFDHSGGTPNVEDLFGFIDAWFAEIGGCF